MAGECVCMETWPSDAEMRGPGRYIAAYRAHPVCAQSGWCPGRSAVNLTLCALYLETLPRRRTEWWSRAAVGALASLPGKAVYQATRAQDTQPAATRMWPQGWAQSGMCRAAVAWPQVCLTPNQQESWSPACEEPSKLVQTLPWATCAQVYTLTHMHIRTHMPIYRHIHTHMHTQYVYATHLHVHTYTYSRVCAHLHACAPHREHTYT